MSKRTITRYRLIDGKYRVVGTIPKRRPSGAQQRAARRARLARLS